MLFIEIALIGLAITLLGFFGLVMYHLYQSKAQTAQEDTDTIIMDAEANLERLGLPKSHFTVVRRDDNGNLH